MVMVVLSYVGNCLFSVLENGVEEEQQSGFLLPTLHSVHDVLVHGLPDIHQETHQVTGQLGRQAWMFRVLTADCPVESKGKGGKWRP